MTKNAYNRTLNIYYAAFVTIFKEQNKYLYRELYYWIVIYFDIYLDGELSQAFSLLERCVTDFSSANVHMKHVTF